MPLLKQIYVYLDHSVHVTPHPGSVFLPDPAPARHNTDPVPARHNCDPQIDPAPGPPAGLVKFIIWMLFFLFIRLEEYKLITDLEIICTCTV